MTLDEKNKLSDELVALAEKAGANPKILRDLFDELSRYYGDVCRELDREHALLFPNTKGEAIPGGWR